MASIKKTAVKSSPTPEGAPAARAELLYQALETEIGGVDIYTTALECVRNDALRKEWGTYLEQTRKHVAILREVFGRMGLDPDQETPGRQVVRHIGKALVKAVQLALGSGPEGSAEIVAAECVTLAETKDHANWSLIGKLLEQSSGSDMSALQAAYDQVEDQEDEHLYHTKGWARELWLHALGLPARLPPPEELQDVRSEEAAARAKAGPGPA